MKIFVWSEVGNNETVVAMANSESRAREIILNEKSITIPVSKSPDICRDCSDDGELVFP